MPPILVKLSPDLDREQLAALCESAEALALAGIVACNTTVARTEIGVAWAEPGGLSGGPLRDRARDVIRHLRSVTRGRLTIVGVGGVASAEDAYGHIRAGANLVELYTGLVYEGPALVRRIKSGVVRLLRRDGFSSISDAVGCDVA
jgi:dihydroorotate dehydrogenase